MTEQYNTETVQTAYEACITVNWKVCITNVMKKDFLSMCEVHDICKPNDWPSLL